VVDAVECAVKIQKDLREKNAELAENRRMEFRVGVNLGDVIHDEGRIYGDGVNVAARVEGLAEAGGICVSGTAFDQIGKKLPLGYEYLGEQEVKNIEKPVRAYKVLTEPEAAGKVIGEERAKTTRWRWVAVTAIALLLSVAGAFLAWNALIRPSVEPSSMEKMAFPLPDKPSIAVLSFQNLSGDPEQEYFSDGLCEDLITDLSKLSGLFVIARNSSFAYKGKNVKISQIAEELGVRYVLEGSVRKAGEQVRINAQLIDATRGHHLWAERYDGRLEDIFALQDKVTRKIVKALALELTPDEQRKIDQKGTGNVAAHDAFLKGWNCYLRFTSEDMVKAVSYFKEALDLDPDYGRAHAALALLYWQGTRYQRLIIEGIVKGLNMGWTEARLRACQHLEIAMKNPTSTAHALQSRRYLRLRLHEKAIAEAEHALALDPNDPTCHAAMAEALIYSGRSQEGIVYARNGMRLDPQNPSEYLLIMGQADFCMGNLKEAVDSIKDAMDRNPELGAGLSYLASSYALLGREQEARAALEIHKKRWTSHTDVPYVLSGMMSFLPFDSRAVSDRFVGGLLKAGFPGEISDYYPTFEENRLTGDEIRTLIFGSTITGFNIFGAEWWIEHNKNGEGLLRRQYMKGVEKLMTRIQDDIGCRQYEKLLLGISYCWTVFRNPSGSSESKDEYVFMTDIGIEPFSIETEGG
jgi:TolB-like protein/Flp pilus assembly protein TadD